MTQEDEVMGESEPDKTVEAAARPIPEVAAVLAWLVPGLGHFYLRQRPKAIILLCAIMSAFVIGIILADFQAISIEQHKYAFFAQIGAGGPALSVLAATAGGLAAPAGREVDPMHSIGLLYTMVAGLLNFVVACDAYERAARGNLNAG
jgi:hypothetical protein